MKKLLRRCLLASALSLAACSSAPTMSDMPPWARHLKDLPLSAAQSATAKAKGFVISDGVDVPSFHLGYTALFKAHQPVYITADAILHALHSSFDRVLLDIEELSLMKEAHALLGELREGLEKSAEGSPEARADVDLYLAVAASLESGSGAPAPPVAGAQAEAIASLVKGAEEASGQPTVSLFGRPMLIDLSMMKPRGHYTRSTELERYFRAMMWLGRTEIRISEKQPDGTWLVNRRALEATAILRSLFSKRAERSWRRIDDTMRDFIGPADSMSFPGALRAMQSLGATSAAALAGLSDADITRGFMSESEQKIGSQLLYAGEHPVSFVPLGQRYIFDSHVLSEVTYGKLEVYRMMPSPLDVADAVFRNPAARDLLKPDLARYGYESALDEIAKRGDAMGPALWKGSLVHLWLGALRELSPSPPRDGGLPAVMKTNDWSRRMLNTQLASWAELRHDTLLYAKQSFTDMAICEYPDAYVEPYPSFFASLIELADKGAAAVTSLDFGSNGAIKARITGYFKKLKSTASMLRAMADLERRREPLLDEHIDFINHAVSLDGRSAGCTITWEPGGWYADLYYGRDEIMSHTPTIADVHTQPTDETGTPVGKVLHVATGKPRPFTVTIDTCKGPRTYHGFVSSYFEQITSDYKRLTDEEWSESLKKAPPPEVPWLSDIVSK